MADTLKQPSTTGEPTTRWRWNKATWNRWSTRALFYILLIFTWQSLVKSGVLPSYSLPGPLAVLTALANGFQSGLFLPAILASLGRLAAGYAISLGIGLTLGLLIGRVNLLKETIGTLVLGLQALPSICWLPLALLWFGANNSAIVFVVVMGAVFSIIQSVETSVRNISPIYLKAARNLGTRGLALYTQVIFPAAFPTILNGLKQGWLFAWRSLMSGELIYTTIGLGTLLHGRSGQLNVAQVIGVMLIIIIIGVAFNALLFAPLEKMTRKRWGLNG